jgi:hypothetical protein
MRVLALRPDAIEPIAGAHRDDLSRVEVEGGHP